MPTESAPGTEPSTAPVTAAPAYKRCDAVGCLTEVTGGTRFCIYHRGWFDALGQQAPPHDSVIRWEVERIIDSYTLCMVGGDTAEFVSACADDVLALVLGWPVRYETTMAAPR